MSDLIERRSNANGRMNPVDRYGRHLNSQDLDEIMRYDDEEGIYDFPWDLKCQGPVCPTGNCNQGDAPVPSKKSVCLPLSKCSKKNAEFSDHGIRIDTSEDTDALWERFGNGANFTYQRGVPVYSTPTKKSPNKGPESNVDSKKKGFLCGKS